MKGKSRMADTGYYILYSVDDCGNIRWDGDRPRFITTEQTAQWYNGEKWCTLLWSCAPTKNMVALGNTPAPAGDTAERCHYFPTYIDFKNSQYYGGEPKAPKDK